MGGPFVHPGCPEISINRLMSRRPTTRISTRWLRRCRLRTTKWRRPWRRSKIWRKPGVRGVLQRQRSGLAKRERDTQMYIGTCIMVKENNAILERGRAICLMGAGHLFEGGGPFVYPDCPICPIMQAFVNSCTIWCPVGLFIIGACN